MAKREVIRSAIPISMTAEPDQVRLAKVVEGLEAAGATLERTGRVIGSLMQGKAIDENCEEREGVFVTAREQLAAARLVAELRGLITRKIEQKNESVMKIRLQRAQQDGGELGEALRRLPAEKRDEVLALLADPKVLDALPARSGS